MKRLAVALVLVAFACTASSEPRTRGSVPSPPPPVVATPTDAPAPLPAIVDAPELVTIDAPSPAPLDSPMTPRTIYPILKLQPDENGGTRVTIGVGKKQGVNTTWKAHLVDKEGRAIRRGELTLVVVSESTTSATTKLRIDDVPKTVQAHLQTN